MRYQDLGPFQQALENLSGGHLSNYAAECERRSLELHVYVLTHHDGLPEGQMKLCLHAIGPEGTESLRSIPLGPRQHELGWNLYLHECTSRVRAALRDAEGCLKVVEALEE
ncbi:MAG: hypothetical protein JRI55_24855, partial [Deltaproteobacteria bacterium]|nr:hypothetical protein [Deltaproteobacteria bacterium]